MSEIHELMTSLNIAPEKLQAFAGKVKSNPFAAALAFSELGLSMEFFSKLYEIVSRDPSALSEYAKSLGMDDTTVAEAQKQAEKLLKR